MTILSNDAAMRKLTALRILAAKDGKPFKLIPFIENRAYAKSSIEALLESDSQEVMIAALEIAEAFELLKQAKAEPVAAKTVDLTEVSLMPANSELSKNAGKSYTGGLR